MALAVVQVQHNYPLTGGSASNAVTFPSATTVGNRAVAIVHSYPNPPGATAVTDNKGNTWTRDFATASGPIAFSVYSAPITTGGTSHIVTAAVAGADIINHDVIEVSGGATGTWLDKTAANSGTGTAYTTGSTGTLTQADEIVFVSVGVDTGDSQTITPDATYTLLATQPNGAGYVSSGAYKIVSVTTAINHAWTTTFGSSGWFAGAVTYKATAGVVAVAPANATHTHTVDQSVVVLPGAVAAASATHAHSVTSPIVVADIVVDSATHAHSAAQASVTIPSPGFTDTFTGANGPLPAPWVYGGTNFTIASNRAHCVSADFAVYNNALPGPDMYVEADVTTSWESTYTIINARTSVANRGVSLYEAFITPTGGGAAPTRTVTIGKTIGGNYGEVNHVDVLTSTLSGTVVLRLECEGSAQRCYINGVLVLTTGNTEITTGNYAGFNAQPGGEWDNWAAGGLAVVVTNISPDSATHAHTAQQSTLVVPGAVSPDSATHAHTAAQAVAYGDFLPANATHAHTASSPLVSRAVYPVSVSSRKLINNIGGVYQLKAMSSWAMAIKLTNAEITTALQGLKDNGFNVVNMAGCGGVAPQSDWKSTMYQNVAGQPFFATTAGGSTPGTPWSSPLGAGMATTDWIVSEADRLGMVVCFAFFVSYADSGSQPDMVAVTNAQMRTTGQRIAARYASANNIIWEVECDTGWQASDPIGRRVDYLFRGITETRTTVPNLVIAEPFEGTSNGCAMFIANEGTDPTGYQWLHLTVDGMYSYGNKGTSPDGDQSVDIFDSVWALTSTYPVWDSEPPYAVAFDKYSGNFNQQMRERNYSVFLRGGCGINYGDEDWWTFGGSGFYTRGGGFTWPQVLTTPETAQAKYCWSFIDTYVTDTSWVPDNTFLTTGLGSGDTRAAAGRASRSLAVYFPSARAITIDTTVISGTNSLSLRWYDPYTGAYSTFASGEARSSSRVITPYPATHTDGSSDWVLVVDDLVGGPVSLAGSSTGGATNTSALAVVRPLAAASLIGASTVTGALNVAHPLGASVAGTSTVVGDLVVAKPLTSTSTGVSTAGGTAFTLAVALAATSTGATSISSFLMVSSAGGLSGAAMGHSSATGSMSVARPIVGGADGASTVVGSLSRAVPLVGSSAGVSTAAGGVISNLITLGATIAGSSTATGIAFVVARTLVGSTSGLTTATGTPAIALRLSGSSAGRTTTVGALTTFNVTVIVGMWDGQPFEGMYYGGREVVGWLLTPPSDTVDV
jgi:hypothetical protein